MYLRINALPSIGSSYGKTLRTLRKRPGRRAECQPRAQRDAAPVRTKPSARPRDGERRRSSTARLHAVSALRQGRQGRLIVRQAVATPSAPAAIGPYSQAIRAGSLLFVSGQVPIDPATGQIVDGDIAAQTHRVFRNISEILKAGGRVARSRRPHDGVSRRHERLRRDERGVRRLLHGACAGARDGAGLTASERRADRDRRDCCDLSQSDCNAECQLVRLPSISIQT